MNIVLVEETQRMVDVHFPNRAIIVEPNLREVEFETPSRTVDVTMTYTLEEFYFLNPFELIEEVKEGNLWSTK